MQNVMKVHPLCNALVAVIFLALHAPPLAQARMLVENAGLVCTAVKQSDGKIIIGGSFSLINGTIRNNLARLNSDGSLDSSWNPNVDSQVTALAINGNYVYVAGDFSTIGTSLCRRVARVDLNSGLADPAWGLPMSGEVTSLAADDHYVYLGTSRASVRQNKQAVNADPYLVRLNINSGAVDPTWKAQPNGPILAMAIDANYLYIGGEFTMVSDVTRSGIAKINLSDGSLVNEWQANADKTIRAIAVTADGVYVGGDFSLIKASSRNYLAKLAKTTGTPISGWAPNPDGSVMNLAAYNGYVYPSGYFFSIDGQERRYVARLSERNGAVDRNWTPRPNHAVGPIIADANGILVGGLFDTLGGKTAFSLAKVNITTGQSEDSFSARVGRAGTVKAITKQPDGKIIIGGDFKYINGQAIAYLARLNRGQIDKNWQPRTDNVVYALACGEDSVYVGGMFSEIGGTNRSYLAKITIADGRADPNWEPDPDYRVNAIAVTNDTVFIGGAFDRVDGQLCPNLARLTGPDGELDPDWQGDIDGAISQLILYGDILYCSGDFKYIRGANIPYLASINARDGSPNTGWQPQPNGAINAIAIDGQNVYLAGDFRQIGKQTCSGIARLSLANAKTDTTWLPLLQEGGSILALAVSPEYVYLGGSFTCINNCGALMNITRLGKNEPTVDQKWPCQANGWVGVLQQFGNQLYVGGCFGEGTTDNNYSLLAYPRLNLSLPWLAALLDVPDEDQTALTPQAMTIAIPDLSPHCH